MTRPIAPVINLAAAQGRRHAATRSAAHPCYLAAEPGKVLLALGDGSQLELSPEQADVASGANERGNL